MDEILSNLTTVYQKHLRPTKPKLTKKLIGELARDLPKDFFTDGTTTIYLVGIARATRQGLNDLNLTSIGVIPYKGGSFIKGNMVPNYKIDSVEGQSGQCDFKFAFQVKHPSIYNLTTDPMPSDDTKRYHYQRQPLAQIERVLFQNVANLIQQGSKLTQDFMTQGSTISVTSQVDELLSDIRTNGEYYYATGTLPDVIKERYRVKIKGVINKRMKQYMLNAPIEVALRNLALNHFFEQSLGPFGGDLQYYQPDSGEFIYSKYTS